jgi:hypothetical protein
LLFRYQPVEEREEHIVPERLALQGQCQADRLRLRTIQISLVIGKRIAVFILRDDTC